MWHGNRVRSILIALMTLAIGLTACGDKNEIEDPDKPVIPVTPVNPEDYVTVPKGGGTITKGDISITFPSGTFSKDTKVAVTEMKKGDSAGEKEASSFYQIVMPAKTSQELTFSIKSDKLDDDVQFVSSTQGCRKSIGEDCMHHICLRTDYSDGAYSVSLPATQNDEDDGDLTFKMGLAHVTQLEDNYGKVKETRAADGSIGNLRWYFDLHPVDEVKMWAAGVSSDKVKAIKPKMNEYVKEAIQQLLDLGFQIKKGHENPMDPLSAKPGRLIHYYFIWDSGNPNADGFFNQDAFYDEYSTIEINLYKYFNHPDETTLRQSVIHETLHYFESDYDPRSPFKKKWVQGEENVINEAASVWAEQFMDNGRMNGEFLSERLTEFLQSCDDLESVYGTKTPSMKQYANHGYGMSALLYYLTKPSSGMDAFDIDKTKIVEIFDLWKSKNAYVRKTFLPFDKWLMNHDCGFMNSYAYEDFLIELLSGKLVQHQLINPFYVLTRSSDKLRTDTKVEKTGECLKHGCTANEFIFRYYKNAQNAHSFKGKEIVIKQTEPDVTACVFASDIDDAAKCKSKMIGGKLCAGDSLVISGEEVEKLFDAGQFYSLMVVALNSSGVKESYNIQVELRSAFSVSPDSLAFTADGGTQSTYIKYGTYSYYGATVRSEGHGWCGVEAPGGPSGEIKVTVQPNTTGQKRECIVDCYVKPNSSSPDSEKVLLPVKVTQEAGDNSQSATYKIEAYLTGTISVDCVTKYNDGRESKGVASLDLDFYKDEIEMEYAGGTLKVQVSDDDATPETLSFSVSGLTGDYTSGSIQSIKYEKEAGIRFASGIVKDANNYSKMTLEIGSLPLDVGSVYKGEYGGTLWFIGKGENLKSVSLKYHIEQDLTDGSYGPVIGHKTSDYSFHSDESNYLGVKCGFWRKFDYSSVPRSVTPQTKAPSMPWNGVPAPSGASLSTHVEANVQ